MSGWRALDVIAPGVGVAFQHSKKNDRQVKNQPGIATPQGGPQPHVTAGPLKADAVDQYAPSRFQNGQAGNGQMTQSPQGWDQTSPGVAEQFWNNQQGAVTGGGRSGDYYDRAAPSFAAPGAGEQYWNQVAGKFNGQTRSGGVADAGVSQYFDRAAQKTQEGMNRQLAASGTLGSSIGNEQVMDALAGLRAQEAMQGANFNLQAAGQADQALMAQLGLGGELASGAQQLGIGRNVTGMNMAGAADSSDLARFNAGMNASMAAQDARRARSQDMFSNVYAPSAAMAGMVGNSMDQMIAGDQEMMDAAMAAELGMTREQLNQSYQKADRQKDDEKHGMQMTKDFMSFWGPGGMFGGKKES